MRNVLGVSILLLASSSVYAEFSGGVSLQQRVFLEDAAYTNQTNSQVSFAINPKYETSVGDSGFFTFSAFARADQRDDERTHFDVREALFAQYFDNWEIRAGIGKVFWGQTESLHLVDVINQTDFVESIDGEDKLGQPMIDIRYLLDTGTISFFVLPYFRERTFPGQEGRLRGALPIDVDTALYESEDEDTHVDYAVRWQQTLGSLELGLAYFDGTSRLPQVVIGADDEGQVRLLPKYNLLQQASIDALYVTGSWLFKLEALQGKTLDENFSAAVAGFEYTLVDFAQSGYDLGLLMEYQYDERDEDPLIFGQNDLMLGARLQINDFSGSEFLAGFVQDIDESSSYSAFVEVSTRLNQQWSLELNAYFFSSDDVFDPTFAIRRDDHVSLQLEYFF
ncbi:hypothetical protein ACFO4O_08390 [Glaciecola siphonariae]|uniref:Phosphate-selective porin O and P n=1 Tax=Glaciecola siphonariae TaxID=521012 RepID=A0ABV9LV50_9ALTE